ncbi:hypothetical protein GUJ93_ZPchr0010g9103 [Zizania palustris]|uniref:RING-type domain-containing protein n=1 Tax=Zizania palustris TaxID=103762 RepID=A0A8J5WB10_ZIZPA|nr:hypothetical protein GUJ93_ZPchr0010g9103 [Zizania palustris]
MVAGDQDSGSPEASVFAATGPEDARFDTNMVIILAALFFALLFAIGLNSLGRCALRCGGGRAAAPGGRDGGAVSCGGGIKKRALRSIPVEVYSGGEATDDVCAICIGEFADGEKVRVLPRCGHGFHVRCVDSWLVSHGSCPTCRRPVMDAGRAVPQITPPDSDTVAVVVA